MQWKCPICKKPTDSEKELHFPFCSDRCRLMDLGHWASGKYVVSEPALEEPAPGDVEPDEPRKRGGDS